MTVPTLPVEILSAIFHSVGRKHDLCSISRCSRTFANEARRVLYYSIALFSHRRLVQCCIALLKYGHLASLVQSFEIGFPARQGDGGGMAKFWAIFADAVRSLTNLRRLEFARFIICPPPWFFVRCGTHDKLKTLSCTFRMDQPEVLAFFARHPSVEKFINAEFYRITDNILPVGVLPKVVRYPSIPGGKPERRWTLP